MLHCHLKPLQKVALATGTDPVLSTHSWKASTFESVIIKKTTTPFPQSLSHRQKNVIGSACLQNAPPAVEVAIFKLCPLTSGSRITHRSTFFFFTKYPCSDTSHPRGTTSLDSPSPFLFTKSSLSGSSHIGSTDTSFQEGTCPLPCFFFFFTKYPSNNDIREVLPG